MGQGKARGGVVNRRGRGKARVVIPFMGRDVCAGRKPDCLKPAGTGVGISARMYNDWNSLGDRAKEGCGSKRRHAGIGEGISARIHVAILHGDRAEEGRRSDRRHSANSLWERVESCVTLVIGVVVGVSRGRGVESSLMGCKAIQVKSADCQWVCVCCFVLLTRCLGISTVPGSFLKSGDLGWPDPHPPP